MSNIIKREILEYKSKLKDDSRKLDKIFSISLRVHNLKARERLREIKGQIEDRMILNKSKIKRASLLKFVGYLFAFNPSGWNGEVFICPFCGNHHSLIYNTPPYPCNNSQLLLRETEVYTISWAKIDLELVSSSKESVKQVFSIIYYTYLFSSGGLERIKQRKAVISFDQHLPKNRSSYFQNRYIINDYDFCIIPKERGYKNVVSTGVSIGNYRRVKIEYAKLLLITL